MLVKELDQNSAAVLKVSEDKWQMLLKQLRYNQNFSELKKIALLKEVFQGVRCQHTPLVRCTKAKYLKVNKTGGKAR